MSKRLIPPISDSLLQGEREQDFPSLGMNHLAHTFMGGNKREGERSLFLFFTAGSTFSGRMCPLNCNA
jgi:hypothetical protein